MRKAALVTQWVVRLGGLVQIVLGLTFWSGHALSLLPVHMLMGVLVSLGLAVLGVLAWRAGAPAAAAALAIVWALVLPVFGVMHGGILPGRWHWVVRLLHLALGIGALGFAQRLADRVLRPSTTGASPTVRGATDDRRVAASGSLN
jgi:hypothetical protein